MEWRPDRPPDAVDRHAGPGAAARSRDAIAMVASRRRAARDVVAGLRFGERCCSSRRERLAARPASGSCPLWTRRRGRRRHRRRAARPTPDRRTGPAAARRGRREPAADRRPPPARPRATRRGGRVGRGRRRRARTTACGPALVLLDLNLPGDTGWDLLRGPALAAAGSPPVVITSATTVSPTPLAEFGVAGYLPKPFPLETLVDDRRAAVTPTRRDRTAAAMTDLQILLIVVAVVVAFAGYLALCDRVRAMNVARGPRRRSPPLFVLRLPAVGAAAPRGLLIVAARRLPDPGHARAGDPRRHAVPRAATSTG